MSHYDRPPVGTMGGHLFTRLYGVDLMEHDALTEALKREFALSREFEKNGVNPFFKGLLWALALSVPLWGIILWLAH